MFSSRSKPVLILVLIAFAVCSGAQDAFDNHVSDLILLQPKPIQKEIGITEAMRAKLNVFAVEHQKRVEAFFKDQQKRKVNLATITPDNPILAGYYAKLRSQVFTTLSPGQLRRLRELTLQRGGVPMLLDPVVSQRVGLTSKQLSLVRAAVETFHSNVSNVARNSANGVLNQYRNVKPKDRADAVRLQNELNGKMRAAQERDRPKIVAAQDIMNKTVLNSMTTSQRAVWMSLLGRPFRDQ